MPTTEERDRYRCGNPHPKRDQVKCMLWLGHPGKWCNDQQGVWWLSSGSPAQHAAAEVAQHQAMTMVNQAIKAMLDIMDSPEARELQQQNRAAFGTPADVEGLRAMGQFPADHAPPQRCPHCQLVQGIHHTDCPYRLPPGWPSYGEHMPAEHQRMVQMVDHMFRDPLGLDNTTSNMNVGELIGLLACHDPMAPVLVLFDNQAGVARDMAVFSKIVDPPDWADPRTIYIDARGG